MRKSHRVSHRPSFSPSTIIREMDDLLFGKENVSQNSQQKGNYNSRQSITPQRTIIQPNLKYLSDILETLIQKQISSESMMTDLIHSGISPTFRYKIVEWIITLCKHFSLMRSVMYSTISLMDRCFQCMTIPKKQVQLISGVSLWMCIKYHCPNLIGINQIISECAESVSKEDFLQCEGEILESIKCNINIPNVSDFINLFEENMSCDQPLLMLLWTLGDIQLQFSSFLRFQPSTIATAIILYSLNCLNRTFQNEIVSKLIYNENPKKLYYCIEEMHHIVIDLLKSKKHSVIEQTESGKFNQAKKWLSRATLPEPSAFVHMISNDPFE